MDSIDLKLIEDCKNGDRRAQEELYRRYKAMLFGVCLRYAGSREEAEDFLQDGFVKIYKNLYQYRPVGSLSAWMRKVVINVALQHLRRKRHLFSEVEIDTLADQYEVEDQLFSSFRAKALMKMIQQLPDGYRTVFNLYVIEGYSHKEIADQLGINEATSKSQLSRAKSTLRKLIEKVV
ncbi:MAG: DNA-directed RNA polymerase sigma-70 factor [Saprospiraceae bacterium]|nr:MAG: DNA-directed RNA polymerase sigma-70 factor [Saprospiraceae bacterium]